MELAKLTSKGQITVPKKIRSLLQVDEGDRIAFIENDDFVIMAKADLVKLHQLEAFLSDGKFQRLIQTANQQLEE
ncbi:AbrB/MazE/SpoVT family DNA-binding domain-containing protein [Exiguobacterium chiriqhucha]|uniref:SpoVT-AbrB domain-containing protein n=1 Tax=Exiguobacterium chiriqhucha RW-2 TaxID=1345023 RepID=U1M000_9BACL|nr:AbrB/MazE/SpoVT family DNA-binding domain-containing protein [Exiguobacterium chiriqhucha]ERG67982.1 hypothetical protein M467_11870 [Exiguobacterium chiriqhucha RW-2]